ncbi:MAG: DUF2339 domain-containing protein [Candidatus Paceibacterota bacterium]|jgi:uncharacterized membrane protein
MFTVIIVLVIVVFLVHQNTRISNLENLIKRQSGQVSPVNGNDKTGTVSGMTGTPLVNQINPASPIVGNTPISQPVVIKKESEESSGRFLGKLGIGAVLVGVAFFLKYAFDNNWIGPSGRVMLGVIVGLIFLIIGQSLRKKYLNYSDLLMGGGSAILYLSIFSAYSFYQLISTPVAGLAMFAVTILTLILSYVNATQTLALVGIVGAFATPFLIGFSEDNTFSIFGYLVLVNLSVLGLSFYRKWLSLNALSFLGTILNFTTWYGLYYNPALLAPTLMFATVVFLIFLVASITHSFTPGNKASQIDFLIMGANAFYFALTVYTLLDRSYHDFLGSVAILIALVYATIAFLINRTNREDKAMNIFLPGLAVAFLSWAMPLQFNDSWIAIAWLIESAVLCIIAKQINSCGFQIMGIIVYGLGVLDFFIWNLGQRIGSGFQPIFNTAFAILFLAVIVAYLIAYLYRHHGGFGPEIQKNGTVTFTVIANILTLYAFSTQIYWYFEANPLLQGQYLSNTLVSILWTLYAAILTGLGFARRNAVLRQLGLILFVITAVKVFIDVWSLGQLYRIISSIAFGLIALIASFAYAKYKDRLKSL